MADKLFKKKINLGYKSEDACVPKTTIKKTQYPSMYISNTKLPLKAEEVGNKFRAMVDVDFTGIRESTDNEKSSFSYDFEIKAIEFINSK